MRKASAIPEILPFNGRTHALVRVTRLGLTMSVMTKSLKLLRSEGFRSAFERAGVVRMQHSYAENLHYIAALCLDQRHFENRRKSL
jgi:hypothetical protein